MGSLVRISVASKGPRGEGPRGAWRRLFPGRGEFPLETWRESLKFKNGGWHARMEDDPIVT